MGKYVVDVKKVVFKRSSRPWLGITGGHAVRVDAKLDVGAVTETVEVEAHTELVNTENATVSHTVGAAYYKDLPAGMGADIRLAESLLQLQPGNAPIQPNGTAISPGSQFPTRLNTSPTIAAETWFD